MRKGFLFLFIALTVVNTFQAQTRGTKVGYIDMEYILQNVPDYTEAQNQLEQKAQKWKQEIETKKIEINKLKDALKAEKALLTKGLIEERNSEIAFLENENLEYQQKRFGPNGDLMIQKSALTKPIQDQVFTAVQDIAEAKKYDFIFDKTSDMTMLFAAKRFDISDQIVRILNRTEKREQLTKKQLQEEAAKEAKEEAIADNPNLSARQKSLDDKKAARDAVIAGRLEANETRRKAAEDRKLQIIADREAKKNGTTVVAPTTEVGKSAIVNSNEQQKEVAKITAAEAKQQQIDARTKTLEDRKAAALENKRAVEEKRKQTLEDRQAKKPEASPTVGNTIEKQVSKTTEATSAAAEAKQKQADARAKILEDRKKVAEENKKALDEKIKQAQAAKETKKTGTISDNKSKGATTSPTLVNEATKTAVTKDTIAKTAAEIAKEKQAEARAKTIEDRNKIIEERKKALEEKRKKILEDREAAKKGN